MTHVTCVDVGQGDCTVAVDAHTGAGLLIDCPGGQHPAAVDELERLGLRELRAAIISHSHHDHFGGVLDVLELLADRFTGTLHFNHESLTAIPVAGPDRQVAGRRLRAMLHRAREYQPRLRSSRSEDPTLAIGALTARWAAPAHGDLHEALTTGNPNHASAIIVLSTGRESVIVGGDAPLSVWEAVAEVLPKGSVVRWPHHGGHIGGDAAAHERLRALLEPSRVVVSVGAANRHGHPTEGFFEALGNRPGYLLCTQATAACADKRERCAGSVRVILNGTGQPEVVADRADHQQFVRTLRQPRCVPPA